MQRKCIFLCFLINMFPDMFQRNTIIQQCKYTGWSLERGKRQTGNGNLVYSTFSVHKCNHLHIYVFQKTEDSNPNLSSVSGTGSRIDNSKYKWLQSSFKSRAYMQYQPTHEEWMVGLNKVRILSFWAVRFLCTSHIMTSHPIFPLVRVGASMFKGSNGYYATVQSCDCNDNIRVWQLGLQE